MNHLDLDALVLESGGHNNPEAGMCVMEAVAFMAREPFSDHPACASPVIAAFMRAWNDDLGDEDRQKLKVYIPRLIGTAGDDELENVRGYMALDWLARVCTPAWLRKADLAEHADRLAALSAITDRASALSASITASAAEAAEAARAARAAWAAWEHPDWSVDQVMAFVEAELAETVAELQASAFDLLDRMIDAKVPVPA